LKFVGAEIAGNGQVTAYLGVTRPFSVFVEGRADLSALIAFAVLLQESATWPSSAAGKTQIPDASSLTQVIPEDDLSTKLN
jgi:hypothetical protein